MKKLLLLLIIPLLFSCNENRKVQELESQLYDLTKKIEQLNVDEKDSKKEKKLFRNGSNLELKYNIETVDEVLKDLEQRNDDIYRSFFE